MEVMEALLSRVSVPPRLLGEPAPEGADLDAILTAGLCAPDHGALQPWRFVLVRGEARERLGSVFVEALRTRDPEADEEAIAKEQGRPLRAPLVIAVCAKVSDEKPNVPAIEQVVAAGAAAMNMMTAAQAKGYGSIMLTGTNAYDPHVKQALGLDEVDEIVCFLYLGTPVKTLNRKRRPAPDEFVSEWTGPPSA